MLIGHWPTADPRIRERGGTNFPISYPPFLIPQLRFVPSLPSHGEAAPLNPAVTVGTKHPTINVLCQNMPHSLRYCYLLFVVFFLPGVVD